MKPARAVVLLLVMVTTGGHKHETDDMMQACTCSSSHYKKLRLCRGLFIGPRQRKSLSSAALGTTILTTLQHLSRVGPSAGWDPRHNQDFAEGQPSARSVPSEKKRAPSHLGCRPLCRRLYCRAVGTDATCAESLLPCSRQRR
jgi:hypothetical protein